MCPAVCTPATPQEFEINASTYALRSLAIVFSIAACLVIGEDAFVPIAADDWFEVAGDGPLIPEQGVTGNDTFTYHILQDEDVSDEATVTITVSSDDGTANDDDDGTLVVTGLSNTGVGTMHEASTLPSRLSLALTLGWVALVATIAQTHASPRRRHRSSWNLPGGQETAPF